MKLSHALALAFVDISLVLSGCIVVPPKLSPPTHLVTIEPDGSIVKGECVLPMQIVVPSARLECLENGVQIVQECNRQGCTYTRDGKVFRECSPPNTHIGFLSTATERDCIENGVHISRKCDHGSTTVTCTETIVN